MHETVRGREIEGILTCAVDNIYNKFVLELRLLVDKAGIVYHWKEL